MNSQKAECFGCMVLDTWPSWAVERLNTGKASERMNGPKVNQIGRLKIEGVGDGFHTCLGCAQWWFVIQQEVAWLLFDQSHGHTLTQMKPIRCCLLVSFCLLCHCLSAALVVSRTQTRQVSSFSR